MSESDFAELDRDGLVVLILRQAAELSRQAAVIDALLAEVDRLTRSGKRQAVPFSKGTGNSN